MSVEKRPAFESPAELVELEPVAARMSRPSATTVGAVLVVLRVLAGVLWLVSLAVQWDTIARNELSLDMEPGTDETAAADAVLVGIVVFGAVVLAVELGLAWAVYLGSNAARLAVLIFATLSITTSAVEYFGSGAEITLRTTLLTLALDILVLLALSSRAARSYARRPRAVSRRRRRRRARSIQTP